MNQQNNFRNGFIVVMILLAAFSRLIPHPHNFTPIGAMALFGGAYFSRKYLVFLVPIVSMWLSDLVINNVYYPYFFPEYYNGFVWVGNLWVYASFILIGLIGIYFLQKVNLKNLVGASLIASILFFLLTNFGAWAASPLYPKTGAGLISAFAAGVPFFRNTLLGDLAYCTILFGVFELTKTFWTALQPAVQRS